MELEKDSTYEATVILHGIETMAGNNKVKEKFTSLGFQNVVAVGAGQKRTVRGRWIGDTMAIEVPKQVTNIRKL